MSSSSSPTMRAGATTAVSGNTQVRHAEHRLAGARRGDRSSGSTSARCARRRGPSFSPAAIIRAAACAASRPARNGWTSDEKTIADAFKAAGYATGAFGKWHNGSQWPYHPNARGFDEYYGHTSGHWGEYFDPPLEHNGRMVRAHGYIVDVCTDRALDFIERHKARPFFCYVPFTTPHSPWAVPDEYWQRFKDKPITQRATLPSRRTSTDTRCALAMMENQDWNVGRVLRQARRAGADRQHDRRSTSPTTARTAGAGTAA